MSVFFTDPFTGANDDPWNTGKWTVTTQAGAGDTALADIQSNAGRMRIVGAGGGASANLVQAIAVDGTHTDIDYLITGLAQSGADPGRFLEIFLRASGDWDGPGTPGSKPSTAYRVIFDANLGTAALHRHDPAGEAALDTAVAWDDTLTTNVRFKIEGSAIKVRLWETGTEEPVTWDMEATDATYASGTIQHCLFSSGTEANAADWTIDQIDADDLTIPVTVNAIPADSDADTPTPTFDAGIATTLLPPVGEIDADMPAATITTQTIIAASGGFTATVTVAAEGAGTKTVSGGSTAQVTVAASGAGSKATSGGSTANIIVTAEGDGHRMIIHPPGLATAPTPNVSTQAVLRDTGMSTATSNTGKSEAAANSGRSEAN